MTGRDPLPYDWSEIRARLQASFPALLDRLGLRDELHHGRGDGRRIFPRNPMRNDRKPGSFVIWVAGDGIGAWKDYATPDRGDIFDLVAYIERLQDKIDVYWWALDFLGLDRKGHASTPRTLAAAEAERQARAREAAAAQARDKADEAAHGRKLFSQWLALPPIAGTPAQRYLVEARGLPLDRLAKAPDALRYADRWEHVDRDGEIHEFRHVMVSAMTAGKAVSGLHFTFLKADGSDKAARSKTKIMVGAVRGAAIRLTRGPTGLSPTKAAEAGKAGPLAIGEGIETCLTVAIARPDYRVWAAGSLSLMGVLEWPACASAIILLRDNDWAQPAAVAAFETVHAHWTREAAGRPVHVAASGLGSDFNDMVRTK